MSFVQSWLTRYATRHPSPVLDRRYAELVSNVSGRVVELGCARGFLFRYYPENVDQLLALEPRADYRADAREAARELTFPVNVIDIDKAGNLPIATDSVDVVVCCEVLCSVNSPALILGEIRRVLRPAGELRVYEHVAARSFLGRLMQRALDRSIWPRMFDGCHVSRDTATAITSAGFEWIEQRHVWFARMPLMYPSGPHVIGRARPGPGDQPGPNSPRFRAPRNASH
jgi:SAM-dependent methyltransferase